MGNIILRCMKKDCGYTTMSYHAFVNHLKGHLISENIEKAYNDIQQSDDGEK